MRSAGRTIVMLGAALGAVGARAQDMPAADTAQRTETAARPDRGAPTLVRIPDASLAKLVHIDPSYSRAAEAHAKVVGAFAIEPPSHAHFVAAWSPGFLPVRLSFSDGRCYILAADYFRGTLSNGRLTPSGCTGRPNADPPTALPPAGRSLRWIGASWGYEAWADDQAGATIVTAPFSKTFKPLFRVQMPAAAMMAMNSPDSPSGNVTLLGPIDGRLTVITLEVSY